MTPQPFALFENNLDPDGDAILLEDLTQTIAPSTPDELSSAFARVERLARDGAWIALALPYELGLALEPRLRQRLGERRDPLLQAWVFGRHTRLDRGGVDAWLQAQLGALPIDDRAAGLGGLEASMRQDDYAAKVEGIRSYIAAGDAYQVNLTFPMRGTAYGHPLALYARLRETQPARHGGIVRHAEGWILSRSPELFVERRGTRITTKPMKGTAPRSATPESLTTSAKERAENVMIVDLIRNDLGRLAPPGGVKVRSLFDVEAYPTVWQMTSTIEAEPVEGTLEDIVRALFPCGSVTGAPKVRAMEIIDELEPDDRGTYCGALGWIAPGGDLGWNVAIRTITIGRTRHARLGIGSGVTHDSTPAGEWQECLVKARFASPPPAFDLFETMLSREGVVALLDAHVARLTKSARWFGFGIDIDAIVRDVRRRAAMLGAAPHRLRLSLRSDGVHALESAPLAPLPPLPTVVLSPHRVPADDPRAHHKTTARALYDRELARVAAAGHFDAVFLNTAGRVAEGARTNVILELDGTLVTPPLEDGVLDGVMRRRLLAQGHVRERSVDLADLRRAERIFVSNALRGLIEVRWDREAAAPELPGFTTAVRA
ncbi:MAG: aminodeoxychorismate synthase component I [Burkholderiales bacterium]|nr:aminodeoxychorismate synthase component I [Burkholderiales bacterium]